MEINLKGQIVILDEAHNIEDSARDAAGGSITTEQITSAIQNLQQLCEYTQYFIFTPPLNIITEQIISVFHYQ